VLECTDDALGDLILKVKNIIEQAVVSVGPNMRASLGFDEVAGYADAAAGFPYAPSRT
jgi:hypothetical protein